jgi:hypothetical protein
MGSRKTNAASLIKRFITKAVDTGALLTRATDSKSRDPGVGNSAQHKQRGDQH